MTKFATMADPTAEDMRAVLVDRWTDEADAAEIAIYWFACHWHGGQNTNLYAALSNSPYSPGPLARLETEVEPVADMVAALEAEFGRSPDR